MTLKDIKTAESEQKELEELLEALGGDVAYCRVYRHNDAGERVFLGRLAREIAAEGPQALQERYGGGSFLVQVCRRGGGIIGSQRCEIAGAPRDPELPPPPAATWAPHVPAPPASIADMLARMDQILQELRRPPQAAASADPMQMALNIVQSVQNATQPLLTAILEARTAGPSVGDGAAMLEAFTMGLKTAAKLTGDGGRRRDRDDGSPWDRVVDEVLPLLSRALNPQPPPLRLPAPEGGSAAAAAPDAAEDVQELPAFDWRVGLRAYVDQLQAQAARGGRAATYAELLYDQLPSGLLEEMWEELESRGSEWWREWWSAYPETVQYESWWREMIGTLWRLETAGAEP